MLEIRIVESCQLGGVSLTIGKFSICLFIKCLFQGYLINKCSTANIEANNFIQNTFPGLKSNIEVIILCWRNFKRNFKWPFKDRNQLLIPYGPTETLICSRMKITSFFWVEKFLILIISSLLLICKKCTFAEKPQMKINS